jgi:hypothetical protein
VNATATRLVAIIAVFAALAGLGRVAHTEIIGHAETRASDALPLYLSGAAVSLGLDPTREESLARVYDERDLSVGAATFSTLYPATAGVLMQPLAALDWLTFTTVWRWILLAAVASFGVSVGLAKRGWSGLAWGAGVVAVLAWHPVTAECVRLGQVNMVLGALCAAAMAALAREGGSPWLANAPAPPGGGTPSAWAPAVPMGLALGLGGALKLVPAALILPLLASRRWRAPAIVAGLGVLALATTLPTVSLGRTIEAVLGTLKFQAAIDPDWLVGRTPAPEWMRVIGFIRHEPLQWVSLALAIGIPVLRPSRGTALAGMATITAWLGADAAGFHVLYAPLAYPVFLLLAVGTGAESRGTAPRYLAAFVAVAAAFYALAWFPDTLGAEPRMVLFGFVAWAAAVWRLFGEASRVDPGPLEADLEVRQAGLALAGVATGVLLVGAMPGDGPVAAPLPEGQTTPEGPGFIHANDRVPGQTRALGAGLDRPASTLARPGTIRHLQLYMRRAPVVWGELAERYPARASAMRARAEAAPSGDLRDQSGRDIAEWLAAEEAIVKQLRTEGLDLADIPVALQQALSSGLTDPGLAERLNREGGE